MTVFKQFIQIRILIIWASHTFKKENVGSNCHQLGTVIVLHIHNKCKAGLFHRIKRSHHVMSMMLWESQWYPESISCVLVRCKTVLQHGSAFVVNFINFSKTYLMAFNVMLLHVYVYQRTMWKLFMASGNRV